MPGLAGIRTSAPPRRLRTVPSYCENFFYPITVDIQYYLVLVSGVQRSG